MPTNLGHDAISALKVGHESVTSAYAGHQQIYPNTTLIQSAAYNSNAGMANTGGTRIFQITGDIGATYDLTGSLTGSYTHGGGTTGYNVTANNVSGTCDAAAATYTVTLTPTGSTTLQGGGSTFSDAFTRAAGPVTNSYSGSLSISASNTNRVTTLVNGQLYWASGSTWAVTWSASGAHMSHGLLSSFPSGTYSGGSSISAGSSGTRTFTLGMNIQTVVFYVYGYSTGCNDMSNSPASTGYLYP